MAVREQIRDLLNVIVVIPRAFARGLDLKCATDSLVFILDNRRDYRPLEVTQSIGRSSRSQSCARGRLFVEGKAHVSYTFD